MNNLKFLNFKFKYYFLLYLVTTVFLISCNDNKPPHEDVEPTKEMLAHIIKTDTAVNMYHNYEKYRLNILKDTLRATYQDNNFNDTRRVWFDLKTLKNYIAYVEKRSAENKLTPEGLQFYFSVYSNDKEGDQKNHQTFFIAPTTKYEGKQSGYTLELIDGKIQPLFLKSLLSNRNYKPAQQQDQKMNKAAFFSITAAYEDGLLYNDGDSSPPMDND